MIDDDKSGAPVTPSSISLWGEPRVALVRDLDQASLVSVIEDYERELNRRINIGSFIAAFGTVGFMVAPLLSLELFMLVAALTGSLLLQISAVASIVLSGKKLITQALTEAGLEDESVKRYQRAILLAKPALHARLEMLSLSDRKEQRAQIWAEETEGVLETTAADLLDT